MFCQNYTEVVQIGLGKSGTSTVKKFFSDRFSYNASCGDLLPVLIQKELDAHNPLPLARARERCPNFYIAELLRVYFPHESIHLQLTHLREIRLAAPSALFVHCERAVAKWVSSVTRWNTLQARLAQRDLEGLPRGVGRNETELAEWYLGANAYLRFAFAHRRNYVRVDVDNPASLRNLEAFCGADARTPPYKWTAINANPKKEKKKQAL